MVIGVSQGLALPMEGALPPDLQGTLFRVGPGRVGVGSRVGPGVGPSGGVEGGVEHAQGAHAKEPRGAIHAVELREGRAVSYLRRESDADAGVFWHAGSLLALPEAGIPSQYSRFLEPQEFAGGLTVPIASHAHRVASDGSRVLFAVEADGTDESDREAGVWLRMGEWDAGGGLRSARSVELERATWQHDIGVTTNHVVFIESPTTRLADASGSAVPFGWVPGAEGWIGITRRGGDGDGAEVGDGVGVRWFRLDPCLVTHVLGAAEVDGDGDDGAIDLYVCRYPAPELGQPVDLSASVVGPAGIGLSTIGGGLAVLERWRIEGERVERRQLDDRHVEYPRIDPACEGTAFRYGYSVEMTWGDSGIDVFPDGLLKFDLNRDDVAAWNPGPWRRASEPLFVRAEDGHGDDEGWLLTVVDDVNTGTSSLYVLDASTMGRRGPEAIIRLPERLPVRSHGEWVPADRYR